MSARRLENIRRLAALKSAPCVDCGLCFPTEAMDFDHVRGRKRANISDLVSRPWAEIEAEIALTELVCSNCHRLRTCARHYELHVELALALDFDNLEAEAS